MTDSQTLLIGNIAVCVIRSRRRTLSIEVGHDGVKARAPLRMSKHSIVDFVVSKQHWIERNLAQLPEPKPAFDFKHGVQIYYRGTPTPVSIIEGLRRPVFYLDNEISVPVLKTHLAIEISAKRKLITWLKQQALQHLEVKTQLFAVQMNVPANKTLAIKVRDYKRRWGSCDHLGQLSFNWRIILAPEEVLEYVVVHELAHCHEFNHSRRFWQIVERQQPDWKQRQQWLHTHGARLYQL